MWEGTSMSRTDLQKMSIVSTSESIARRIILNRAAMLAGDSGRRNGWQKASAEWTSLKGHKHPQGA